MSDEIGQKKNSTEDERNLLLDGGFLDRVSDVGDVSVGLLVSPADIEGTDQSVMFPFISVGANIGSQFHPETEPRQIDAIVSLGEAAGLIRDLTEGLAESLGKLELMSNATLPPDKGQIELSLEILEGAVTELEKSIGTLRTIRRG